MDASITLQTVGPIAIGVIGVFAGIWRYVSKQLKNDTIHHSLVAPPIDSKIGKDIVEAIRDYEESFTRENKKNMRSQQELRDSIIESTEATILQTDATTNLLKFIVKTNRKVELDVTQNQ